MNGEILNPPYCQNALHQNCGGQLIYFPAKKLGGPCERCADCGKSGRVEFEETPRGWEFVFDDLLEAERRARRNRRHAGSFEAITGRK